jgi:AraC-like DNA-binding protein
MATESPAQSDPGSTDLGPSDLKPGDNVPGVPTVFARSVRKVVNAAAPRGNTHHLLRTVGLEHEAITDPALRIPYADMMLLSEHAAHMTRDPAFGLHVGERVEMREYGVVGQSVITSATLGEALRCQVRYLPAWTNVGFFRLDIDGPVAHFQWEYSRVSLPDSRHDCETSMATVVGLNRLCSGARWTPREVWFQHAKPKDTGEHARIFRAPVRFGMPSNALLLDRTLLDVPLKTARPSEHRAACAAAERLLATAREAASFSQSVISLVRQQLAVGSVEEQDVARRMGVSRRTLQRKLMQESSSFRQLVRQARQDLSEYLLLGTNATATETAYALGFSEPSVFHRAFSRWHGIPPQAYRRSQAHSIQR